jgi:hypothetical protein
MAEMAFFIAAIVFLRVLFVLAVILSAAKDPDSLSTSASTRL